MREILFRGKGNRKYNSGGWYYGYLFKDSDGDYVITEIGFSRTVIPETVGQYTGLTDKNGVRVFEGDICRFKRFNDVYVGEIVFNVITASFVMWYQSSVGAYGEKAIHKMLLSECDDIEVIGNVHDNPGLLKGE